MSAAETMQRASRMSRAAAGSGRLRTIVRRRIALISAFTAGAALLGAVYAWSLPDVFEATATVRAGSASPAGGDLADEAESLLRSAAVLDQVVDRLGLGDAPELAGFGLDPPADAGSARMAVRGVLARSLAAVRRPGSDLIDITVSAQNADRTAQIATALADTYLRRRRDGAAKSAVLPATGLEQRLNLMRQRLEEAERRLAAHKAANPLADADRPPGFDEAQASRLLEETIQARLQLAETGSKLRAVQQLIEIPGARGSIAEMLDSAAIRSLKEQLAMATRREAELDTQAGSEPQQLHAARIEIRGIEGRIATEVDQALAAYRGAFEAAEQREQALTASIERMKSDTSAPVDAAVTSHWLAIEAGAYRALYGNLLDRQRREQGAAGRGSDMADLVSPAAVPGEPVAPVRLQIAAHAAALGLAYALGLALLLEMLAGHAGPAAADARSPRFPTLKLSLAGNDAARAHRLILTEPAGAFAQAIAGLRSALDARPRTGQAPVLLVAECGPQTAASVIAANLALHYASSGCRTLLIDGDLRRAALSRACLPRPPAGGVLECLAGNIPFTPAVLYDATSGLSFLPAHGADRPTVSVPQLLAGSAFAHALDRLRREFELIVIAGPAVLTSVDASLLAERAGEVLLVAGTGTSPDTIRRAVRSVGAHASKLAGLIELEPAKTGKPRTSARGMAARLGRMGAGLLRQDGRRTAGGLAGPMASPLKGTG
jgi:polysaccharide biosynthesis transport protein